MRRLAALGVGLALSAAALSACSSFGGSDDPSSPDAEAGIDPPVSSVDASGDATADGGRVDAGPPSAYATLVLGDGPLHYFRMDDDLTVPGAGLTDAVTGQVFPVPAQLVTSVQGAVRSEPSNNRGFAFAGRAISIPNGPGFQNLDAFTIELWATVPSGTSATLGLLGNEDPTASGGGYSVVVEPGGIVTARRRGTTVTDSVGSAPLSSPTKLVHIAWTFDGAAMLLYLDGMLAGSKVSTALVPPGLDRFVIGARTAASGVATGTFTGTIDEVAIYGRAVSGSDLSRHHAQALKGVSP